MNDLLPWDDGQDAEARRAVTICPEAVPQEMVDVPAQIALWNYRAAEARRVHLHAQAAMDRVRAQRRQELRHILAVPGVDGKRPTVDVVKDAVAEALERDDAYIAALTMSIEAETQMLKTQAIARAVSAKRDMLMCLGGLLREELKGDPMLRDMLARR